ncbi:hypothetical protein ACQP2T_04070 [Nonomuraea sp. CA-143628]|uniref:hypothetical protein n=1 Tax=Nonomuraea sp. CA-143628 TaxID=3239997 RepID=UPI003D8B5C47
MMTKKLLSIATAAFALTMIASPPAGAATESAAKKCWKVDREVFTKGDGDRGGLSARIWFRNRCTNPLDIAVATFFAGGERLKGANSTKHILQARIHTCSSGVGPVGPSIYVGPGKTASSNGNLREGLHWCLFASLGNVAKGAVQVVT